MPGEYEEERLQMVEDQIRRRGISDPRVLEAFQKVPRHEFVPQHLRADAYRDCPLPIGEDQTISQPYMVASMTLHSAVMPGDRVLEIGTGSGYQAAILAELGGEVFSIERREPLLLSAREVLTRLGYTNVRCRVGDGTLGWKSEAPFFAILVTAGAPRLPEPLIAQLAVGGRLVIPVEEGFSQVLYIVRRTVSGISKEKGDRCTFVPLVGKYGWEK
jgi:protein-L-isoaspartate(D-aspartate) O-methyltransferase